MGVINTLFSLENKTVIIAGAAQGIGKTVAGYLAGAGANIVILDKQIEKAAETAKEIEAEFGKKAIALEVDVTNPDDSAAAIKEADKQFGDIHYLFNNAGIVLQKPVVELDPNEWTNVIDVNLNGIFFVAQVFGRYLIEKGIKGSIVNTASMSGTIVNYPQKQASYNTAKAGVVQLTKSLAVEWAEHGIRVNCISPGYIYTELTSFVREDWQEMWKEQTPMKRMGRPEELAGTVIYLLSDASSYATGTNLIIDGGFTSV